MGVIMLWDMRGIQRQIIVKFMIIPRRNEELFLNVIWNTQLQM